MMKPYANRFAIYFYRDIIRFEGALLAPSRKRDTRYPVSRYPDNESADGE